VKPFLRDKDFLPRKLTQTCNENIFKTLFYGDIFLHQNFCFFFTPSILLFLHQFFLDQIFKFRKRFLEKKWCKKIGVNKNKKMVQKKLV